MTEPLKSTRHLGEVLDDELARTASEGEPHCGARHPGNDAQECVRVADHKQTGDHSRELHAALVKADGVEWPELDPAARYWVTWVDVDEPAPDSAP